MMGRKLQVMSGVIALASAPAIAAPCMTSGTVDDHIAFPTGQPEDVPFVRSMVPIIFPEFASSVPQKPSCTRLTVKTAEGLFEIGGENGDAVPRMAVLAKRGKGPLVYLAESGPQSGKFALAVRWPKSETIIKYFYSGIPTDERLAEDIKAALSRREGIMGFDASQKMVHYYFQPPQMPPPVQPGQSDNFNTVKAGPQIFLAGEDVQRFIDIQNDMRHRPSGFACPDSFEGLAVLLMAMAPQNDSLTCNYRSGTDLRYDENDPVRYQLRLFRPAKGETPETTFAGLKSSASRVLRISGEHRPPMAAGPPPAPQYTVFWDMEDGEVQGVWVGQAGLWIAMLRARFEPSAATEEEAGEIAKRLFDAVARQLK